jgi:putative endonuclease
MSAAGEGVVYEIHFDEPIGDPANPKGWAQHYIGHTTDLDRRTAEHRRGSDAAIMRAVGEAGIGWHVVRTWPGTRDTERQIKLLRSGRRLCPECTEHPLTGAGAVARASALRQEREAARAAVPEPPRPAAVPPYEAGRQMARQFMERQNAAGRTAAQIEAAHDYITGPWHEMGHHTADQAERFRGYTDLITAALAQIREYEAEAGDQARQLPEEERMQENEAGSWLARDGDGQVLEVDADGRPGREASPDDGRPVAEPEEPAGWQAEAESAAWGGREPYRSYAEWAAEGRQSADEAGPDTGQAYVAGSEEEFADYWGGQGPTWEAQAEATTAEPAPGTGPYDVPWWDGERMASDRDRTPDRVAEMEAEAG